MRLRLGLLLLAVAVLLIPPTSPGSKPFLPRKDSSSLVDDRYGIDFINGAGYSIPEFRYQQAVASGARWDRWPMYWHLIEPTFDQFDYRAEDEALERDLAHGLKVEAILLGTPGWTFTAGSAVAPFSRVEDKPSPRPAPGVRPLNEVAGASSPPRNLGEPVFRADGSINRDNYWGYFVYNTVSRYKDRIKVWEMWNEPDFLVFWLGSVEDYYQLLKVGYLAAKAADPDATVLLGGLAYWTNAQFLPRLLDLMASDPPARQKGFYFDALPVHLYASSYDIYQETTRTQGLVRSKLGVDKRIWVNEANVPVCDDAEPGNGTPFCPARWRGTMEQQADFVIQAFALAAAADLERLFMFQFYDDVMPPREWYGLVRNNSRPRPSFYAYQVAARYLINPQQATYESRGQVEQVTLTGTPHGKVTVVWNNSFEPVTARIKALTGSAQMVFKNGDKRTLKADGDYYVVDLPPTTYRDEVSGTADIGGEPYILVESGTAKIATRVEALPDFAAGRSFTVAWSQTDATGIPVTFDIEYREGKGGSWKSWLSDTSAATAVFGPENPVPVKEGEVYYFRSRGRDPQGDMEPDPPADGHALTKIPLYLSGRVSDNRDNPLRGATVASADGLSVAQSGADGRYSVLVFPRGTYDFTARKEGFTELPYKAIGLTESLGYDFVLPPKQEAVANGGFEDKLNGWTVEGNAVQKSFRHTGKYGAYIGAPGALSQKLTISPDMQLPTLSFFYRSPASSKPGELKVSLAGASGSANKSFPIVGDDVWHNVWIDAASIRGEATLRLSLEGADAVVWLDEVSLGLSNPPPPVGPQPLYLPIITSGTSQ
ncbi:MAG: carboxypeptidase regulatory-like domain-containing protein [Chloroflexi bacterium]|nr:carboxypeptidase regulatory-like domain-containing protein [Chloroflexota bacterium]